MKILEKANVAECVMISIGGQVVSVYKMTDCFAAQQQIHHTPHLAWPLQ